MPRKTSKGGVDLYFFRGKTMPTNLLKRNLIDSLTAILLPIKRNNFLILWFFFVKQVCKQSIKEKIPKRCVWNQFHEIYLAINIRLSNELYVIIPFNIRSVVKKIVFQDYFQSLPGSHLLIHPALEGPILQLQSTQLILDRAQGFRCQPADKNKTLKSQRSRVIWSNLIFYILEYYTNESKHFSFTAVPILPLVGLANIFFVTLKQ